MVGNLWENSGNLPLVKPKGILAYGYMKQEDFFVFKNLVQTVYSTAFYGQDFDLPSHTEREILSAKIEEATQGRISGKTLWNYAKIVRDERTDKSLPDLHYLNILARYVLSDDQEVNEHDYWYTFRQSVEQKILVGAGDVVPPLVAPMSSKNDVDPQKETNLRHFLWQRKRWIFRLVLLIGISTYVISNLDFLLWLPSYPHHTWWVCEYGNGMKVYNQFRSYRTEGDVWEYYSGVNLLGKKAGHDCNSFYFSKDQEKVHLCYDRESAKKHFDEFGGIKRIYKQKIRMYEE